MLFVLSLVLGMALLLCWKESKHSRFVLVKGRERGKGFMDFVWSFVCLDFVFPGMKFESGTLHSGRHGSCAAQSCQQCVQCFEIHLLIIMICNT